MRVLIATATAGAGHLQAAAALREAWEELRPHDELRVVDVLDFTSKLYKKIYSEGYLKVVEHVPELYAVVFRTSDNPVLKQAFHPFRKVFSQATARKFLKYMNRFRPAALICPHFLPVELVRDFRKSIRGRFPLVVCVVTDFRAHAFWVEPGVDLYCVAAEETKQDLTTKGVAPERVRVTGIPVSARFRKRSPQASIRKQLQLDDRIPTLLVLSGGFGVGPVGEILHLLDSLKQPLQILVVTGRNEKLKKELEDRNYIHPTTVFGFVKNMEDLMSVSDLIITKAGGLTVSEALTLGKPLVIVNPIPGQESANCNLLRKRGAAVEIRSIRNLPRQIRNLLRDERLKAMKRASASIGRSHAAIDICRETLRLLSSTSRHRK